MPWRGSFCWRRRRRYCSRSWKREQFGADVLALLDQGRLIPATDYINAQRLRRKMRRQFAALWAGRRLSRHPGDSRAGAPHRRDDGPARRAGRRCAARRHAARPRHQCAGTSGAQSALRVEFHGPADRAADRRAGLPGGGDSDGSARRSKMRVSASPPAISNSPDNPRTAALRPARAPPRETPSAYCASPSRPIAQSGELRERS